SPRVGAVRPAGRPARGGSSCASRAKANDRAAQGRSLGREMKPVTRLAAQSGEADFGPIDQNRLKMTEPLVPPKPKEFDRAISIFICRAVFGTKSRSQSGSGVR